MLRDIKGPFEIFDPLFFLIILILLSGVILFTVWILKRRKKRAETAAPNVVQRPPEEIAHERLTSAIERYRKDRNLKVYYSDISNIVRDYIGQRYFIDALEKTTSEIFVEMRKNGIDRKVALQFKEILSACDLVKFAKLTPPEKEAEELYNKCILQIHSGF